MGDYQNLQVIAPQITLNSRKISLTHIVRQAKIVKWDKEYYRHIFCAHVLKFNFTDYLLVLIANVLMSSDS